MNSGYISFKEEASDAIKSFPDLQLCSREDSVPVLKGSITLFDKENLEYDSYHVRIECDPNYPKSFPLVYENDGRLPHNIDWHVYDDGHFCICTPVEEYIYCAKGITLESFIKDQVLPYLHNQNFREKEGYFLQERSHGVQGILESLYDILNIRNLVKIHWLLTFIYKNSSPSRTSDCFCQGGKKYRHCHREAYRSIKSMGQERLLNIIFFVKNLILIDSKKSA